MSDLLHTYRIGHTTVEVWGDCVRTLLMDGRLAVVAAPNEGETMQDCIDHELAHTYLAWFYGRSFSHTMYHVARRQAGAAMAPQAEGRWIAYEEEIVLTFVRGLQGTERPWDRLLEGQ